MWDTSRRSRVACVAVSVLPAAVYALVIARDVGFHTHDGALLASPVATVAACLAGLLVLCLGLSSRPWIAKRWHAVAVTGVTFMMVSYSSA